MTYHDYYKAIDEIENSIRKDLVGPIEDNEVIINDEPLNYYPIGVLWPKRLNMASEASDGELKLDWVINDTEDLEDNLEGTSESIDLTNQYKPSAMAITVMVDSVTDVVQVEYSFAKYLHSEVPGEKRIAHHYKRKAYNSIINFKIEKKCCFVTAVENDTLKTLGIGIGCHIRKVFKNGSRIITISLTNQNAASNKKMNQNEGAIFQCGLTIQTKTSFVPIYQNNHNTKDEEVLINNMLYRDVKNYAYGHGCSVKYAEIDGHVNCVSSEFIPTKQVLQMMPNIIKNDAFLYMNYWEKADRKKACKELSGFVDEYIYWCKDQEDKGVLLNEHTKAVKLSIEKINTCINRLVLGIETLASNDGAWEAFILMNEAMLLQRIKTKNCTEDAVKWYPFQLAYILQIIPDIVNDQSDFRNVVDLLWFPTGGGKTEAYLGLAAFVIFYRRISNKPIEDGVTIIMRYTLRLLTIQQFERATALICACEHLRKVYQISGGEISIGLWIGSNMTPNHLNDAAEKIQKLRDDTSLVISEGNPIQIMKCPWCGTSIDVGCYNIEKNMTISCKNNKHCEFHEGLPIYIVDDDIYERRPTLILSTVDKFARIVWEERSKSIFGINKGMPPELIIQDELHLISGPLGSIAGIYEVAIEKLCERNGKRPKIIASTATVKNANAQIKNLYNMGMFQFPPNGILADDSFFAVRADKDQRPARRYIGLCETGGSLADLLIRVYANLTFMKNLFIKQDKPEEIIDQYYTTVGYFNAIKDLGASSSIINDRVNVDIKALIQHKFAMEAQKAGLTVKDIHNYEKHNELTSRKSSREIKETLEQLSKPYTSDLCYSYILATNMLSVGIDIDRLGVMSVYNQPKLNAEYIQATSRVGRNNPGLVLTMYNGSRSRDKSYYEQFSYYHKTLYEYVESTSVTPYSARSVEKALHAVFVAIVRHTILGMGENKDAIKFRNDMPGIDGIKKYILERVESINPKAYDYAKYWLDCFSDTWERLAIENKDTLVYNSKDGGLALLIPAEKKTELNLPTTLNALRNVDSSSNIYILTREE